MSIAIHRSNVPGGLDTYRNLDVGTTGAVVFNTRGAIFEYYIRNNAVTPRYLKLYDKSAAPTSADTPIRTVVIPSTAAANLFIAEGIKFSSGCGIRVSTAVADNDGTAPSANDVIVNIGYR